MSSFKSPEFKKLKSAWYERLESDGFEDIENERGDIIDNKTSHQLRMRIAVRAGCMDARRDYFIWATHALQWAIFQTKTDRIIWAMHSDGASSREIAVHVDVTQRTVCTRIQKIRGEIMLQEHSQNHKDE